MGEGVTGPNPPGTWDVGGRPEVEEKEGSCFWGHKWSKWKLCGFTFQTRTCLRCGKIQNKTTI